MKKVSVAAALMGLVCALGPVSVYADSALAVEGAYVRKPIPGKDMSAAFMQIHNGSEQSQQLVSASAAWASSIELHTHTNDNGVMRMRQVPAIDIPAAATVTLQPGGLHLMLFGLQQPLPEQPQIELCFADQHCQTVTAELKDMRDMPAAGKAMQHDMPMQHGNGMHNH